MPLLPPPTSPARATQRFIAVGGALVNATMHGSIFLGALGVVTCTLYAAYRVATAAVASAAAPSLGAPLDEGCATAGLAVGYYCAILAFFVLVAKRALTTFAHLCNVRPSPPCGCP